MKIQNIATKILSASVLTFSVQAIAKPLIEYRKELSAYKTLQKDQIDKESDQLIKKLLRSTDQGLELPMALLQTERLAKLSSEPRISFSTNISRFLSDNSSNLRFDEEFQKPTTVNPKWSVEQSRAIKKDRIQAICAATLQKFNLDELAQDLAAEGERTSKSGYSNLVLDPRQDKDLQLINDKILGNSSSKTQNNLLTVLGKARHLEIVNGVIQEIHVSTSTSDQLSDNNTVSLSLPLLIGAKLGTNKQFSRSIDCLETYFREQADILTIRQAELQNQPAAQKVKDLTAKVNKLYELYQNDKSIRVRLTEYSFKMLQYMEQAETDPAAAYLLKRQKYLLGKNLSVDQELALNDKRLHQAKFINPYLKLKSVGAKFAVAQLKKLSDKEFDSLIWFLTAVRGVEIPTSVDVSALEGLAKSESSSKVVVADYLSAKRLYDSLTNLSMRTQEPKP